MGNANSGPRATPTALKLLRGTTRKDRLNPHEPEAPKGPVEAPESLTPPARAVWEKIAPICIAMGTLTQADVTAFARFCELQATAQEASSHKSRPGFSLFLYTTMVDSAGNEHQQVKIHPAIRLEGETAVKLRPYYDYFGLTPSGRARLQVKKDSQEPEESKWAGAIK
jgi:P27 family predicted phage terminase small subunit